MHCAAGLWAPVAPSLSVTALGVDAAGAVSGTTCYAGCRDGSISTWRQQQAGMAPVALLQGHAHPIVAVLPGLTGPGAPGGSTVGSRHLLSLDAEGWLALWDCSTWRCLDMTRAAPLPAGARPTLLLMPDQEHVCVIIPATPSLQQEQQTLWQHQQHQQQEHQQARSPCSPQQHQAGRHPASHPATAAHLSPMMLVLRWASLALVAAPLVSNLGLVVLTSSSVTLDAADAVVAAAVLDTAPALSPTAADSVVLAVSRSGWMWAGSLTGSSLGQAWEKPLAAGASTAPLSSGCLRVRDASAQHSSAGGSHTEDVQLQLLVVQGDAWRLLVGSHFSSSTGMPQQWTQVAQQQLSAQPGRSLAAAHSNGSAAAPRVRFALRDSGTVSAENECLGESDAMSGDGSSSGSSSESESACDSGASARSGTTGVVDGTQCSRLARCPTRASRRTAQQHEQLLGGVLLQAPGHDTKQQAVVVWTDRGQQQLWVVQEQLQQQQPAHTLQLQPWPAPRPRHHHAAAGASPAAAGVFAAADAAGSCYVLLSHHHTLQHLRSAWPWLAHAEQLLPHRHPGDWHMHACRALQHTPDAPSSDGLQPQQKQWQLHAVQGSWKAAWGRQGLYSSSSSAVSSSTLELCRELHEASAVDRSAESAPMAVEQPGATAMDATPSCSAAGRKRPAAEAAAEGADGEAAAGGGSSNCSSQSPAPGVAKQPRVATAGAGDRGCEQHAAALQVAAALQDGQQQQVTRMQLLGSDAPGVQQLAVMLESGAILFYDLALYCVPGAAWHPDCCCVGSGHIGRVTCTVEVVFRCPPRCLLGAPVSGGAAAAADAADGHPSSLPWPVNWNVSEHSSSSTRASDGSSIPAAAPRHHNQQQQQQHGHAVFTAAHAHCQPPGTSCRPAQGGNVPLLLTGGKDGSVRAWDLRLQHLGEPWMSVHPHTAAVEAIVLPPVSCRLPWSCCVLSVCVAGRVALSCLATGTLKRSFDGWGLGPPAQLAWSTGRGLLAAGGWDAAGLWQVAVWDTYTGQLDRQLSGGAAHMLMATLAQELTSSMRHLRRAQGQAGGAGMLPAQQLQATAAAAAAAGSSAPGAAAAAEAWGWQSSAAGSVDLQWQASGDGRSGGCEGGQFVPRLQLAPHSSGPLAVLPGQRPDVLLLDVDVQQLVAGMEAHTRQHQQQHRGSSRQRQAARQQSGLLLGSRTSSFDADSIGTPMSARSSRANSLDLTGPFACLDSTAPAGVSSATSPQQQQQQQQQAMSPAAAASDSTIGAAPASHHHGGQPLQQCVGARLHSRTPQPPAIAAAVQGLCLLHRWGLEPRLDEQLLLLLLEHQGWGGGIVSSGGQEVPAATADARHGGSTHALIRLLMPLLQDPAPGSPILCHIAPCLSQELLLSGHGAAAALNMPAAPLATALEQQAVSKVAAAPSLGVLLPAAPSMLASRLLTLVALSKWLMTSVPTQASVFACSGLVTQYALHLPELLAQVAAASKQTAAAAAAAAGLSPRSSPAGMQLHARSQQPASAVQTDLLLLSSAMLACPGLLAEAAQLLLTALLHPAVPGSYAVLELPQAHHHAEQQQLVFTLPGAAAAASCWPPAVMQLAVLQQLQQQQQQQQAGQSPQQQQPALSLSLQQLPLWLPQLVLSAAAAVGHPAEVPPELLAAVAAALIDVLLGTAPASSSCIAAGWLCQLLRSGAWAVWRPYIGKPAHLVHRLCSLVDRLQAANTDSRSAASAVINQVTLSSGATHHTASSASGGSSEYRLLAQQPYAICDPRPSSSSIAAGGGQQHRQQHIEGGLFISAALLGSSELGSNGRQGTLSRAASPAAGLSGGINGASGEQLVTTPSGIMYSTSAAGLAAAPSSVSGASGAVSVRMSRRSLVVWLRAALDLLAAVTQVDPAAVLMELSHKLAAPSADASSSSLALMVSALGRVLRRPAERPLLLPHLGFTAALAVQALDPARPALRHAMLQPVMSVVKELAGHFHQVDCHGTSLQLAVGSTRPLVGQYSGSNEGPAGSGGGAAPSMVLAPTVAVFDMNGGTSKKVLLLPVLPHAAVAAPGAGGQQEERPLAAGAAAAHRRHQVGPFGSTSSLASATSSASSTAAPAVALTSDLPSGMPSLWAAAEGSAAEAAGGGHSGLVGGSGSSSSLASTVTAGDEAAGGSRRGSRTQLAEQLQRGQLSSNTMTRAEAAMVEHWFGRRADDTAGAAGGSDAARARAQHDSTNPLQWGVWYPDAGAASRAVLTADDVSGGVAAVAFSPAGDAVAAFVLGSHCLVVWRLQASWTQKLANLGTSKPLSQLPHAYIRIPSAASLANAMLSKQGGGADSRTPSSPGGSSSEVMQWQLKWQASGHIDLLFKGSQCGSVEVRL